MIMFEIGDTVKWRDESGQWRIGIVAYIAPGGSTVPAKYFTPATRFNSKTRRDGRYIVDCGVKRVKINEDERDGIVYRQLLFSNETAEVVPFLDSVW